ncbi:MAG TPA: head-tail connector protein [Nocardioides sp.]|nr:head-tail connector protein [Nocardioides sp.]
MAWAPNYASIDQLREYVRIDDVLDDEFLTMALAAASRAIDHACDPRPGHARQFGRTDTVQERYFTAVRRGYAAAVVDQWIVPVDDIALAQDVVVALDLGETGLYDTTVTGFTLLPRNAAAQGWPWQEIGLAGSSCPVPSPLAEAVRVSATWGWPEIPEAITQACLLQASRLLSRRDAPFGTAGSPETGSELRLLARIDPDVETTIRGYVRRIGTVLA